MIPERASILRLHGSTTLPVEALGTATAGHRHLVLARSVYPLLLVPAASVRPIRNGLPPRWWRRSRGPSTAWQPLLGERVELEAAPRPEAVPSVLELRGEHAPYLLPGESIGEVVGTRAAAREVVFALPVAPSGAALPFVWDADDLVRHRGLPVGEHRLERTRIPFERGVAGLVTGSGSWVVWPFDDPPEVALVDPPLARERSAA